MANLSVKARLAVAEKNLKGYEYATAIQNEGIKQMQMAGEAARAKANESLKQAFITRKHRDASSAAIMRQPAPVSCEESRVFAIDLAKQLVEGR